MEEWRDIKGYEGIYQVSSFGRVRSLDRVQFYPEVIDSNGVHKKAHTSRYRGRIMKQYLGSNGYLFITLYKDGKHHPLDVHRLVAITFINGYRKGYIVNHKDECKTNNHANNLEWVSCSYNTKYSVHLRNRKTKAVIQYDANGCIVRKYKSASEAARTIGMHRDSIYLCCNGKGHTAGGYIWKYE